MATPKVERPYRDADNVETVRDTLVAFGYGRLDARYMAREIISNLDNYMAVQETIRKRLYGIHTAPTQTRRGSRA